MTRRIVITAKASQDINKLFEYLAQHDSEVALRFFDATRQTIAKLATIPGKDGEFGLAA